MFQISCGQFSTIKTSAFCYVTSLMIFLAVSSDLYSQYFPKEEMRAIWIATVNNIDWPSKPGLSANDQKAEMIKLLDKIKEYNLNTVVFQIRPAADAFHKSSIEPWSQWLNGKQGKAPDPFYDPLDFVIQECRTRGLDVHAWLNPYRAVTDTAGVTDPGHITRIHPEWFLTYGRTVYFDPGLPQTRDYFASVVSDIVRRYDIDAIHMDDYFYPYRIAGVGFPDDSSFVNYSGGSKTRDDWRRENVNLIIKQLSDSIRAIKPWVEFGISPFGVWRNSDKDPEGSATKAGQTNYDDLFADILLWEKNGWIDYVVPQIYWHIGFKVADYNVLSEWWSRNANGCKLYIGQAPYRIDKKSGTREWRNSKEILKQVQINRTYPTISGSMYFSARVLPRNPKRLQERLTKTIYRYPSLQPVNKRIATIIPGIPSATQMMVKDKSIHLSWEKSSDTRKFIIYKFRKGCDSDLNNPANIFLVTSDNSAIFPLNRKTDIKDYTYYITARSQTNAESEPALFIQ